MLFVIGLLFAYRSQRGRIGERSKANSAKSMCDTNGVEPGKRVWYRMAGVNGRGQSPWSEPTPRPVM